jgi:hypothetical protein
VGHPVRRFGRNTLTYTCVCGCGEPVNFSPDGVPRRFIKQHHARWLHCMRCRWSERVGIFVREPGIRENICPECKTTGSIRFSPYGSDGMGYAWSPSASYSNRPEWEIRGWDMEIDDSKDRAVGDAWEKRRYHRLMGNFEPYLEATLTYFKEEGLHTTRIYNHGEDVSVITTAIDERDFVESFTVAYGGLSAKGLNGRHHRQAMQAGFDIIAKLRGYKSEVQEKRMLAAGRWPHPSEEPVAEGGEPTSEAAD